MSLRSYFDPKQVLLSKIPGTGTVSVFGGVFKKHSFRLELSIEFKISLRIVQKSIFEVEY